MKITKKLLILALALIALTLVMSISIFAEESTEPTVYEFNSINSFISAYNSAQAGDIIRMTADTTVAQLNTDGKTSSSNYVAKAVTIDLNGYTLTTTSGYSGVLLGGGASMINGTILHKGNTSAFKAANVNRLEDLTIKIESQKSNTGGVSMRNIGGVAGYAHINVIKNVKMIGTGNYGIETYGQGDGVDKTKPVIDLMENCEIDSITYALDLSCSIGTIKDCVLSGSQAGISCKSSNGFAIALNLVGDNDIMGGNCAVYLQTSVTLVADEYTDFINTNGGATFSASATNVNNSTLDIVGFSNVNGVLVECAHEISGGSCTERSACSVCGKVFDYVHSWVEDESKRVAANCTVQGKAYFDCACGATKEEFIARDPNAHEWVITTTDATHSAAGTASYNCKYGSCVGEEYTVVTAPVIPHEYTVTETKATCEENGKKVYTCSCGDSYEETIPALGHNYVAGDEVDGKTEYTCTNCGDSYTCEHEYVVTRVEPTEEAAGSITTVCTKCDYESVVVLPKLVVYYVANISEFNTAYNKCTGGEIIRFTNNISTSQIKIEKDITIDLNGYTLTTNSTYGGMLLYKGSLTSSREGGKFIHTGKTCAIKVFGVVPKIENITITLQNPAEDLMLGGIVLQSSNNNTRKIYVGSIKNVTINGEDLSNGIETYNCGNQADENGVFNAVIGGIENVKINSRQYGMWISANVGDIKNCTIHGDEAGIKFDGKGTGWAASANLINSTVDGNQAAVKVDYQGGIFNITGDKYTNFSSASGVMFQGAPAASENVTFDMVGVTVNADGSLTFCQHENVTLGDCDTQSECSDCTRVLGYNHTYVETSRVESTCTEAGVAYYACECGATTEADLPYAEHVYDNVVVTDPTCMREGFTTHTCVCGDTYNDSTVEKDLNAHSFSDANDITCNNKSSDNKITCDYVRGTVRIGDVYYATIAEALAAAKDGETVTLLANVEASDIIVIDKSITLDGNGKTISSTAGRAINVSGAVNVTIENLTVVCTGERGINVIQGAANVTVDNVNVTAANYAINLASSAAGAKVTVANSTLTGLNVVNVGAPNATVMVDNTVLNCEDNAKEGYSVFAVNKDAKEATVIATNVTVNITGTNSEGTSIASNAGAGAYVSVNGLVDGIKQIVAYIEYGEYYYGFASLKDALNKAVAGETIVLLVPVTVTESVEYTIPAGVTISSEGDAFIVTNGATLTLNGEGTVNAGTSGVGSWCAVWANGGHAIINGGTYTVGGDSTPTTDPNHQNDVIYTKNGGTVTINGGTFVSGEGIWVLNQHDATGGAIVVYGGSFVGFNPANNASEGPKTSFVATGYHATEANGTYTVAACEYNTTVTAPTCSAGGYTTYTCACGYSYNADETPKLAHTEVAIEAILPTPSTTGYTAGVMCSECGETLEGCEEINITEISNDKNVNTVFRIAAINLSAQESLSVNYKALVTAGYKNPYVVFVFNGEEYIVTEYKIDASSGRYVFNFNETFPQLMQDNIEAYLYGETAEGEYTMTSYLEYSVMQYIVGQIKKNDAALTTVMSDILYMGAMTQIKQNYKTNALVTDLVTAMGYTLTPSTFTSIPDDVKVKTIVSGDRTTGTDWKTVNLALGATTELKFGFETDNLEGLTVKITVAGQTYSYDASELKTEGGRYFVYFDKVRSYEYDEVVTATFERNGEQVGSTLTYTVNTFLASNYENSGKYGAADRNLMKALYTYGESIAKYFA